MADFTKMLMNPWVLHLQKLELELKCPLCLKLLNRPVLLPCDHVFCNSCINKSSQVESGCPVCKSQHPKKARRNLPFMESVISIYKSLNAAVNVRLPQVQIRNDCNYNIDVLNKSKSPKDCESKASDMIDKVVIERNGGLGQATKSLSDVTASKKLDNAASKRICGGSLTHYGSKLPNSQETNLNHKAQDQNSPETQDAKRKRDITTFEATRNHLTNPKKQKNLMLKSAKTAKSGDQLTVKKPKASDFTSPLVSYPSCKLTNCEACRFLRADQKPRLFTGLKFYFFGEFSGGLKEGLQNVVRFAGGTTLNTEDELVAENSSNGSDQKSSIVVYSNDRPQRYGLGEEDAIIKQRVNEAEAFASKTGSRVVGHKWLGDSIVDQKLHPIPS